MFSLFGKAVVKGDAAETLAAKYMVHQVVPSVTGKKIKKTVPQLIWPKNKGENLKVKVK